MKFMKKIIFIILTFTFLPLDQLIAADSLASRLAGRILLQVESYGRAWYVDPVSTTRYYLRDGEEAFNIMRSLGLGITNKDLAKIPTQIGELGDQKLVNRLKGRILLQVENNGEAWYVNPVDGLRYYLPTRDAAFNIILNFGLGITNDNLRQIKTNSKQIIHDTTFKDVAYVSYDGMNFSQGYNSEVILPLASLTKLMTALVLLDLNPDWQKIITITKNQLDYPKSLVGEDITSEIDLQVGDKLTFYDLWLAMLIASSNQSTVALVDNSGLSRKDFIKAMNQKAIDLGLNKTLFFDMTGLDAHNVTTAKEMAIIAQAAFTKTNITSASAIKDYTAQVQSASGQIRQVKIIDRNYSLHSFKPQAVKTGFLVEAQHTVVLQKDGLIVVVLHALSIQQRNNIIKKLTSNYK